MTQRGLVALTVLGISMAGVHAFAQQGQNNRNDNGDRVCFYRDVQFEGPSWCYRPGDELADLRDRGNEISSIRVFGRARVIVYDLDGFMGVADEFDMDVADLRLRSMERRRDWNDRIDSFQVVGRRRGGPFGGFGRNDREDRDDRDNRPARDRICVYEEPNYSGRSQCWTVDEDVNNLSGTGWNDRISSVRVFGRAHVEVYRDSNYRGGRIRTRSRRAGPRPDELGRPDFFIPGAVKRHSLIAAATAAIEPVSRGCSIDTSRRWSHTTRHGFLWHQASSSRKTDSGWHSVTAHGTPSPAQARIGCRSPMSRPVKLS